MNKGKVCFKDNCFDVDLAISSDDKKKGLMFVDNLDESRGMLFIYDKEGIYGFWMKNTKIPLDIIWINKDREVVFISRNTQPCLSDSINAQNNCLSVNPGKNAKYVLEINAGIADRIGLLTGDKIDLIF